MAIRTYVIKLNYKILGCMMLLVLLLALTTITYVNSNATNNEGIRLPIIMYHSILKSQKGSFIVSPEQFEADLKYITEKGYTTITMQELIDYVYNNGPIPEKPIIITFDDGYYNNYTYAIALLQKYNMKAVISIVGSYTDTFTELNEANSNYSYLRWCDINLLINTGIIEFQNHSYNMHLKKGGREGTKKKKGESSDEYKKALVDDITKLQDKFKSNTNYVPTTFTYPFGSISKESTDILKELGFKASLSCREKMNYITKDPNCLYLLNRYNRLGYISTDKFFKKILS